MMSLLKIEDLSKTYSNNIKALNKVSFDIGQGEVVGIVGESGSGKSTLSKLILGLETYKEGIISFMEQPIPPKKRSELRSYRKNIQMVFQDSSSALNPKLPIWKSLLEPLENYKEYTPSFLTKEKDSPKIIAAHLLEMVGLEKDMFDRYPDELSGGQKQRVCLARAISMEPALLVCDEVTASLDVTVQIQIIDLLKELQRNLHMSILFISHDLRVVTNLCDRIIVLKSGCLVDQFHVSELYFKKRDPYTKSLLQAALLE
jgi:peptide/nickel transport system ATP-binding protein